MQKVVMSCSSKSVLGISTMLLYRLVQRWVTVGSLSQYGTATHTTAIVCDWKIKTDMTQSTGELNVPIAGTTV